MYKEIINPFVLKGFYHLVALVFGLGMSSGVYSGSQSTDAARQMLIAMVEAVKSKTYKGTVVYLRDNEVETMQVFHANSDGVEKERIVALNTPMREVIRTGDKVTCYFPDARMILVDNQPSHRAFLVQLPETIDKYSKYYDFVLTGHEYVIRKETQVIYLSPRDDYRYGRKIWIDIETQLPLKFELIDEKGILVEQMMFTDLQVVEDISPDVLAAPSNMETSDWEIRDREHLSDVNQTWVFGNVPGGFRQVFYRKRIMPTGKDDGVEHILFSDGFSSVSVYVDRKPNQEVEASRKKMGAINSYSRLLDGYQITVLGAVPGKTVQSIGDGIDFTKESGR